MSLCLFLSDGVIVPFLTLIIIGVISEYHLKRKELDIIVVGKTGAGKSTLINTIVGEDINEVCETPLACNRVNVLNKVNKHWSYITKLMLTTLDTVGLDDVRFTSNDLILQVIKDDLTKLKNPKLIYLINFGKITQSDVDAMSDVKNKLLVKGMKVVIAVNKTPDLSEIELGQYIGILLKTWDDCYVDTTTRARVVLLRNSRWFNGKNDNVNELIKELL